jgi:WD40 repeat protein
VVPKYQRETRQLRGHGAGVTQLAVLPNGTLISASYEGTIRAWSLEL